MILILDSTRPNELHVGLLMRQLSMVRQRFEGPVRGQLLNVIDALLKREHAKVAALTGVVVATGPGPFSALRAAAAIGNAMGLALRIPAVGISGEMPMQELAEQGRKKLQRTKPGHIVVPHYGKPAHITRPPRR